MSKPWSQIKRKKGAEVSDEPQNNQSPELEKIGEAIADATSEEEVAAVLGDNLDGLSIDEMTPEQAEALAGAQQMQMPMMQIPLQGCGISILPNEEGGKTMIVGPIAVQFVMPFSSEGARNIAKDMTGIEIATSMPTDLKVVK